MTTSEREILRQQLLVDEGLRLFPYRDTVGKLTLGVGRNLTDVGITAQEAYVMLENDIDRAVRDLVGRFPWVANLDSVRQAVLINLTFNMGISGLSKFVNTMAAIERGNWELAVTGLKASLWFRQVQMSRSHRLIQMMRTGEWPNQDRA